MTTQSETEPATLYARLGGREVIAVVAEAFYARVLEDPRLSPWFGGVSMSRQSALLASFLSAAFGGPVAYNGRSLREVHAGLALDDSHFDAVTGHLAATLKAFGVPDEHISEAALVAESVRAEVLGH